jgi:hypothetical protein
VIGLILHYSVYLGMVVFGDPDYEVAVGLHEKIGPCDEWIEMPTVFTLVTGKVKVPFIVLC